VWTDREGRAWVAKDGFGLLLCDGGLFQEMYAFKGVRCLYGDRQNRLWVCGTGTNRMRIWQDGRFVRPPVELPPDSVATVVHEAQDGAFWFGTKRHGLFRWRNGQLDRFTVREGLASDAVWAIHEDAQGVLWLGGERGLTRLEMRNTQRGVLNDAKAAFPFSPEHGLPAEEINQVLEDDFGHLWLGTLRGVLRVRRAALNAVAAGRVEHAPVAVFGIADGMESSETNGERQPAGCKTRDGRLWFPTTRGVAVFDPQALPSDEHPPKVVIEEVVVDGEAVVGCRLLVAGSAGASAHWQPATCNLQLAPGQARLVRFRYTAPTFVSAERARFRYRLRGQDGRWHDAGGERVAYFTNLDPGDYLFEVTACNAHGVWQETPAQFAFSLAPTFVQTGWFPASLVLGGGLFVGAVALWRLRWQRRSLRAEQAAALADERARIAQDLHDDLGTALTGVALQLDVLRRDLAPSPEPASRLGRASTEVRGLAARMREVVWAVNPRCDSVPSLAGFLEQQAEPLLAPAGITPHFEFPDEIPALPLDTHTRHQLALAVREVLTNMVRHSRATDARLSLRVGVGRLHLELADNGRGFDPAALNGHGHGLTNLRTRLVRLGGACEIQSAPGQGTQVRLSVPLSPDHKERA